jgi:predicted amidohydrolase
MKTRVASICPTMESSTRRGKLQYRFVPVDADEAAAIRTAEANLQRMVPLLESAAAHGAKIACLPEDLMGLVHWNTAQGRPAAVRRRVVLRTWARFREVLATVARDRDMIVCAGAYEVDAGGRCFNAAALFDHRGRLLGTYRKVQLAGAEAKMLKRGDAFPVFRTRYGRIGMCICWDIVFPEVTQALMVNGADLILLPTWGHSGPQADFTVQARAHDACTPIVVSMWCGGGRIVDRDGTLLAAADAPRAANGLVPDQIIYAELDPRARRAWLNSSDHKRRLLRERQHVVRLYQPQRGTCPARSRIS